MKVKVKSLSCVRLLATPSMDCSLPGSSIHGIFQARVLELLMKFLSVMVPSAPPGGFDFLFGITLEI